ncbi:MAG: PKD domain-containing protein [Chitinophagaceae bacterium]|nr:PKD domain-containing protein [Chitinophagaceae bacterium]
MKKFFWGICFLILILPAEGAHIKGGFFTYRYLGPGSGTNLRYQITLTVYMVCNPLPGQLNDPINFSIYDGATLQFLQNVSVSITSRYQLFKNYDDPCITGNETGCYYEIVIYNLPSIELAPRPEGYVISYQRCCRISGIVNVVNSGSVGNTFTIRIPGTSVLANAPVNSSPQFLINDTMVICNGDFFQFSFQANDPDGDSLSYSFCEAFQGGTTGAPAPATAPPPPYATIPYQPPYSGAQPLGAGVSINPANGVISGTAPNALGQYVICVCVNEYRNGTLIGTTRKELHVVINDCDPLQAQLAPQMINCRGFTVNFSNQATNPPGTQFLWNFGDPSSGPNNISTLPNPTHTYSDTGTYTVKLKVSLPGGLCADSTTSIVKVYPGFSAGFVFSGSCFQNPFQFTDTTYTRFGVVNSWRWDFGDLSTLADTSRLQNPQYTYSGPGNRTVRLIAASDKGCIDTALVEVPVLDRPALNLAFRDTLICRNDVLQLSANGTGQFSWTASPPAPFSNPNISNPLVSPVVNTWFYVTLDDRGCINRDSLQVRVVQGVNLRAMNDTIICLGDQIQLNAQSDGLSFEWSADPGATFSNPNIINPLVSSPHPLTRYTIRAIIGGCSATDDVMVRGIPYPSANAGPDLRICYNSSVQLNATINASSFAWSPAQYLSNPIVLNPVATPPRTTSFILTVYDTLGCPKPGRDTVVVFVQPRVRAYAGRDTTVVVNQPLYFNASGGVSYLWIPSTGLNNPNIPNPVGRYGRETDSIRYKVIVRDEIGCPDSAYITVYVFKTNPSVFVPSAFTPNNDGLNDVIRPIAVGIREIRYFAIYNRWGERVFYTTANLHGWDGIHNGKPQPSGVFVWLLSAVDYLGNPIFRKGTVTLIR